MSQSRRLKPIICMLDYAPRWAASVDERSIEVTRRARMTAGVGG